MAPPDPDWVGGVVLDVGDHRVAVQADSAEMLDAIGEVFAAWIVGDGEPSGDFGISVARRGGAGPRLVPQLLHGRSSVLRSRSLPRLLRRLDLALGELAEPRVGTAVQMAAFVRSENAVLVPTRFAERSTGVERAVIAAGATIAEQAAVRVDLAAREIEVVPGLTEPGRVPRLVDELITPPARYALRSICWSEDELVGDERAATAVARFAERVDLDDVIDRQAALEHIAALRELFSASVLPRSGADASAALVLLDRA